MANFILPRDGRKLNPVLSTSVDNNNNYQISFLTLMKLRKNWNTKFSFFFKSFSSITTKLLNYSWNFYLKSLGIALPAISFLWAFCGKIANVAKLVTCMNLCGLRITEKVTLEFLAHHTNVLSKYSIFKENKYPVFPNNAPRLFSASETSQFGCKTL